MKTVSINYRSVLLSIVLFFVVGSPGLSQIKSEISTKLDSLYSSHNFEVLDNYALTALLDADSLSVSDRAELYKYLGIVYILQDRGQEGKQAFSQWLRYDPAGYIDSFRYPPNVVNIYTTAKAEIKTQLAEIPALPAAAWKPTFSSTLQSVLIPGLGHFNQGKEQKGLLIFTAQAVTITGWLICENNFDISNRAYYSETDSDQFDPKYNTVNNWYRARNALAITSIAVYVFAQTDFFLFPQFSPNENNRNYSFSIYPVINTESFSNAYDFFRITVKF